MLTVVLRFFVEPESVTVQSMRTLFLLTLALSFGCGSRPLTPMPAAQPSATKESTPIRPPVGSKDPSVPRPTLTKPATSSAPQLAPTLTRHGLDALRSGVQVDESVLRQLFPGATITRSVLDDGEGGGWPSLEVRGPNNVAVDLRLTDDRIEQIWIVDSGIETAGGVRVGDPLGTVMALDGAVQCFESAEGALLIFCSIDGVNNLQYVLNSTNTTGVPQRIQASSLGTRKITAIRYFSE